jgi:hypothetical protein
MSILGALKRRPLQGLDSAGASCRERLNSAHRRLERPLKYSFDVFGAKKMILVFRSCSVLIIFKCDYPVVAVNHPARDCH